MACIQIIKSGEYKEITTFLQESGLEFDIAHTVSGVDFEEVMKFGVYVHRNLRFQCREDFVHDYMKKWTWFFGQGHWNMLEVYESSRYVYEIMKRLSSS